MLNKKVHPFYQHLRENPLYNKFSSRKRSTKSFIFRTNELMDKYNINKQSPLSSSNLQIVPWTRKPVKILFDIYKKIYNRLCEEHSDYVHIYTDGSKVESKVGCAIVTCSEKLLFRLPTECSVFTAELYAILEAVEYIHRQDNQQKYIIFTDSFASLQSINNLNSENILTQNIQNNLQNIINSVILCWIPGHCGIKGNEEADTEAKSATLLERVTHIALSNSDIRSYIREYYRQRWRTDWQNVTNNKLRNIKENITPWEIRHLLNRREAVVVTRMRTGHTRVTHDYLIKRESQPECERCQQIVTVKHIMCDCILYNEARQQSQASVSLREALAGSENQIRSTINFLKLINIFYKI